MNSKGESLEDIVKVGTPSKFDKLITTRAAATVKTGLWKLPLSVAEGVSEEDFKKAVTVKMRMVMKSYPLCCSYQ